LAPIQQRLLQNDFRINLLVSLPFPFFQELPIFENGMNHLKVSSTTEKKKTWKWKHFPHLLAPGTGSSGTGSPKRKKRKPGLRSGRKLWLF